MPLAASSGERSRDLGLIAEQQHDLVAELAEQRGESREVVGEVASLGEDKDLQQEGPGSFEAAAGQPALIWRAPPAKRVLALLEEMTSIADIAASKSSSSGRISSSCPTAPV